MHTQPTIIGEQRRKGNQRRLQWRILLSLGLFFFPSLTRKMKKNLFLSTVTACLVNLK
jgi:hypothetical protein